MGWSVRARNRSQAARGAALVAIAALSLWPGRPALADDEPTEKKKIDLTLRNPDDPEMWIRPNVRFDTAWFTGGNAWGGDTKNNIGNKSNGWAEFGLVPALDGQMSLGENGTLNARVSGVYTTTQLGLDWGGSNFWDGQTHKPSAFTLEDAYLRWTSGPLVEESLGTDAIDISVGSQQYKVGTGDIGHGFLFYNAGSDGGNRGGYWLGLRNAFEVAAIARLTTGEFSGETVYLRSDDRHGDHTNSAGINGEYDFGKLAGLPSLKFGLGYWNLFQSNDQRRDGLNVVDFRLATAPLSSLPGLGFSGEFVKEKKTNQNDSWAAWGELGYDFDADEVRFSPYLSYRYAYFSGDDQSGDNDNAFDPLYYGFSDWNYWYIGEIAGEWVTGNSNFQANILRLRANPFEPVTFNFYYIYLRLNEEQNSVIAPGGREVDPRVAAINDKDLSHELDFIVDWQINQYFSTSVVAAVLVPLNGAQDFFGNDEPWTQFMVNTSFRF